MTLGFEAVGDFMNRGGDVLLLIFIVTLAMWTSAPSMSASLNDKRALPTTSTHIVFIG